MSMRIPACISGFFRRRRVWAALAGLPVCLVLAATSTAVSGFPQDLDALLSETRIQRVVDRNGRPLAVTYGNRWNVHDIVPLHDIPPFLIHAFLVSEDRRFHMHRGVDWRARAAAVLQNLKAGRIVRGASTIPEQVARMIAPRPRTLWAKWVEGWEAALLSRAETKQDILEFYLNQVPYAANRRGVAQAARYYFDRDLSTLTKKEMLALAVLVRAPDGYDLYRNPVRAENAILRLAEEMRLTDDISEAGLTEIRQQKLSLSKPSLPVHAGHFVSHARAQSPSLSGAPVLRTTLDSGLQARVQDILDMRVQSLRGKNTNNGAAIVVDHVTGEILAWVVAGAADPETPGRMIDAVLAKRQPGSAQKPFLYALALDDGWTASTTIDDAPLAEAVGTGLHAFRNYSNVHYGRVSLREALGNSLNIPAVLTIHHVGAPQYLETLRRMGFGSLDREIAVYDEGLALGNGEVTLLEMAQGFATLANRGLFRPLRAVQNAPHGSLQRIYSPEAASLIGNILSDPFARRLEFGDNSVLNLPVQTAAKTGTSTDYRDAWTLGYNHRYVVGVWMGNLDRTPTDGVTGASGPALAFRSIFAELGKRSQDTAPLWLSPKLALKNACVPDYTDTETCRPQQEFFMPETDPSSAATVPASQKFEIVRPTDGLQMAFDPRLPSDLQRLPLTLRGLERGQRVEWVIDGTTVAEAVRTNYLWPVSRGQHVLLARIFEGDAMIHETPKISYVVK